MAYAPGRSMKPRPRARVDLGRSGTDADITTRTSSMPMCNDKQDGKSRNEVGGNLLKLGGLALLVGGFAGLLGAAFRLALLQADQFRDQLVTWAQGSSLLGLLLLLAGCGAAAALAAWLVRRFAPHASGSGIPQVEAVLHRELPQP